MLDHVFISYARADGEDIAKQLCSDLSLKAIPTWLDQKNIETGANWDTEIDKGLQAARAVLVVLTPGSVLSDQVRAEWITALNQFLPVIPVVAKPCKIPRVLTVLNYIDARVGYSEALETIAQRIHKLSESYLDELKSLYEAFEAAQREAPDPSRFQDKIDRLHQIITNWSDQTKLQQERISAGLYEEHSRARTGHMASDTHHVRVVGTRPGVIDYFFDREEAQEKLGSLLRSNSTKLISIIGSGGMGKTTLACKILANLASSAVSTRHTDDSIDGIVYLSTKTKGINVEQIFAHCSQLLDAELADKVHVLWSNPHLSTLEKTQRLLNFFPEGSSYVLLLDNLEDLLDGAGTWTDSDLADFFIQVLSQPCGLRLLITTRVPVQLPSNLAILDTRYILSQGLPTYDGINLLRKYDASMNCGLGQETDKTIGQLVERIHGIPRALEIAAGILANDPFSTINDLLEKFFKQEDVVKALIKENYKRLSSGTRMVMDALAVFGRPTSVLAIDYLLQPFAPGLDVPQVVSQLSKSGIINVDREAKTVLLHPMDIQYCYNSLPEQSDYCRVNLERQAADYYHHICLPKSQWTDIDSVRYQLLEFEHRVKSSDFDGAARILGDRLEAWQGAWQANEDMGIQEPLLRWGHGKRVIGMRHELIGKIKDNYLIGINIGLLARAYNMIKAVDHATSFYEQALEIARELSDHFHEVFWLHELSMLSREETGDIEKALEYALAAEKVSLTLSTHPRMIRILLDAGRALQLLYSFDDAIAYMQRALDLANELEDNQSKVIGLGLLGNLYIEMGNDERGIQCFVRSLEISQQNTSAVQITPFREIGDAYILIGDAKTALSYYEAGLELARKERYVSEQGVLLCSVAYANFLSGDYEQATQQYGYALEIAEQTGRIALECDALAGQAQVSVALSDYSIAINKLNVALQIAQSNRLAARIHPISMLLAEAHLMSGNAPQASTILDSALNHHDAIRDPLTFALQGIANAYLGESQKANASYLQAVQIGAHIVSSSKRNYSAQYAIAFANFGLALLTSEGSQENFLANASVSLDGARATYNLEGILDMAQRRLTLLKALDQKHIGHLIV